MKSSKGVPELGTPSPGPKASKFFLDLQLDKKWNAVHRAKNFKMLFGLKGRYELSIYRYIPTYIYNFYRFE